MLALHGHFFTNLQTPLFSPLYFFYIMGNPAHTTNRIERDIYNLYIYYAAHTGHYCKLRPISTAFAVSFSCFVSVCTFHMYLTTYTTEDYI
jgi:hypothetical protein